MKERRERNEEREELNASSSMADLVIGEDSEREGRGEGGPQSVPHSHESHNLSEIERGEREGKTVIERVR